MSNELLVPQRECGECTVCCIEPTIEDPELVKLPGVKCQHLAKAGGCTIYKSRPETCKKWFCMWRFLPTLDDGWRPDLKGVLLKRNYDNIPIGYEDKISLEFEIIGKKSVIHDVEFMEIVGGYIMQGFACFISYGKPKHSTRKAFLNDLLLHPIEMANVEMIKEELSKALRSCVIHSKEKMAIRDGKIVTLKKTKR